MHIYGTASMGTFYQRNLAFRAVDSAEAAPVFIADRSALRALPSLLILTNVHA